MEIPPQCLPRDVLQRVVEEFVSREGTDYGERGYSLEEKVQQVLRQLQDGEIMIVFDPQTESTNIVSRR
jgi:uncharacterized protein YheU (UPF0270 family)